jgi:putative ABC transport system permease protein
MKHGRLLIVELPLRNLRGRPFRTASLLIVVSILSFVLFGGSILLLSLQNGMHSMERRLGADLMVVPRGYERRAESALLRGEPSSFYLNKDILLKISQIKGIEQCSPQFFLTSLNDACCSLPVQMIGFDPDTDFVVQPWISTVYNENLSDGQLIVGSEIDINHNNTLIFFRDTYQVAAHLDKTATGLDTSIFMNMNTMRSMLNGARGVGYAFDSPNLPDPDKMISTALLRIDKDYDLDEMALSVLSALPEASLAIPKQMMRGIASSLNALTSFLYISVFGLWLFAALLLSTVFFGSINERKKEFAIYRVLGMTRKKLFLLVMNEATLVSLFGSVIGIVLASLGVFPFSTAIGDKLNLPYINPDTRNVLLVLSFSLALPAALGPLGAIFSAFKISKAETYLVMREGE